jgi:hypothetical protein
MSSKTISKLSKLISKNTNKEIVLLRNQEVLMWLYADTEFIVNNSSKTFNKKSCEDKWGIGMTKSCIKSFCATQWTGPFGELLAKEILILLNKNLIKPQNKNGYKPDIECDEFIWEIKSQTYFTTGTAGEKILGVPFKYAEIPKLYNKNLKIMCIGNAEVMCREKYGNLPDKNGGICCPEKKLFLNFYKENGIEYIGATDLLDQYIEDNINIIADIKNLSLSDSTKSNDDNSNKNSKKSLKKKNL